MFSDWRRALTVTLLLPLLVACGGGSGADAGAQAAPLPEPEIIGRGKLEASSFLNTVNTAEIVLALQEPDVKAPSVTPVYAVSNYRLNYRTIDGFGREVIASGLLSVPVKPPGAASPMISYQHGTIFKDVEAPSNHAQADEAPVIMASLGYIVLAADYVGFGVSKGHEHPYLLAKPSAAAVLDLLTAGRSWRSANRVIDNGQLFLVGYSEGGYVTMAAHQEMQRSQSTELSGLLLSVPGAGPYNVGMTMDVLLSRVRDEYPLLAALINPGLLRHLGSTVRDEVRRALLRELIPDDADVSYQANFVDNYLADDVAAIGRDSNVHDWQPQAPVYLFHGRDDQTVPYASSESTLQVMGARAAAQVSLTECTAAPAGHSECVAPYWIFMLQKLAGSARDL